MKTFVVLMERKEFDITYLYGEFKVKTGEIGVIISALNHEYKNKFRFSYVEKIFFKSNCEHYKHVQVN